MYGAARLSCARQQGGRSEARQRIARDAFTLPPGVGPGRAVSDRDTDPGQRMDRHLPDSLAECLTRIGNREVDALSDLYRATSSRLLAICLRITQSRVAAEDVLQEVYLKIWNRAAGYDPERAEPMVWLSTLARNSAIDWYRAQARKPVATLADAGILIDEAAPADEAMIERERTEQVASILGDLRSEHREMIRAIYFEGLTYAELAEREGVPLGTVKSRIHRILAVMAKAWCHD